MQNKKGLSFEMIDWIIKITMLFIVVSVTIFFIHSAIFVSIETQEMRTAYFIERVLYSPSGIVYIDPTTNRPTPWKIDLQRFTTKNLEAAITKNQQDIIAAKFDLTLSKKDARTIYFNEQQYTQWKKSLATGSQVLIEQTVFVLVHYPETNIQKLVPLTITVITPKG